MVRQFWTRHLKQNKGSTSRSHGSPKLLIKFSINCFVHLNFNQISRFFSNTMTRFKSVIWYYVQIKVSDFLYMYNIIAMYKLWNTVQRILHWFCDNTRQSSWTWCLMKIYLDVLLIDPDPVQPICCLIWRKKIKILNKTPWIKIRNYRLR